MIRRQGSPYEVRCHRCDVSFPVGTRRCIHCSGATAASDVPLPAAIETGATSPWIRTGGASSPDSGAAGGVGASGETIATGAPGPVGADGLEIPEEAAPSLGATLLRTFGSLFWVIALIAFSILRSCGED